MKAGRGEAHRARLCVGLTSRDRTALDGSLVPTRFLLPFANTIISFSTT